VAAVSLARDGWRPQRGALRLVFVADEETGGDAGARWLTERHPDKVRCDMLINEGGGDVFELDGRRRYGICCAEKGIFRFKLTARGQAGHASLPRTGENALLKLGPLISRLAERQPSFDVTEAPAALLQALGGDAADPQAVLDRIAGQEPALLTMIEPMLGVTFTPTMAHASEKMNVIPARAYIKVDCRVPPGLGEDVARQRISEVLGELEGDYELEFTERVVGNASSVDTPLTRAIAKWVQANDEGASTVPVILPGFSDSRWFREAFPDCAAYGFFPQRYMSLLESAPLVHSADERIDVRDLGFAARFFAELPRELLG
jgi:acetylornithine deacetylase/succinyl-diaminopimelate desuccinylase-like protein